MELRHAESREAMVSSSSGKKQTRGKNGMFGSSRSGPQNCSIATHHSPKTNSLLAEITKLAFCVPAVSVGIKKFQIDPNLMPSGGKSHLNKDCE